MNIDLSIHPVDWYIWLPIIAWFTILFFTWRKWKMIAFIIPLFISIILLQPQFSVYQSVKKDKDIYIDTSYPTSGIYKPLLQEVLYEVQKKYSNPQNQIKNLDGSILGTAFFENAIKNNNSLTFQQKSTLKAEESEKTIITYNLHYNNNSKVFQLPIQPVKSAILDFQIDELCTLKEVCNIKILVFSEKNQNAILKISSLDIQKKIVLPANKLEWIHIKHSFHSKKHIGTFYATIEIPNLENNYPHLQKIHFLISIKENQPKGYFLYPEIDVHTWRISNAIEKNRYLSTKAESFNPIKKSYSSFSKSNYYIQYIQNTNQITNKKSKLPYLYISIDNDYIKKYAQRYQYKKIEKNIFQKDSEYICNLTLKNRNNIFYDTNFIERCTNIFSQSIQIQNVFMPSQIIEPYRNLIIYDYGISKVSLLYNTIPMKQYYDFQKKFFYYNILFYNPYTLNINQKSFSIQPSIPIEQRSLFINYIKQKIQSKQSRFANSLLSADSIKQIIGSFRDFLESTYNTKQTIEKRQYSLSWISKRKAEPSQNTIEFILTIIFTLLPLGILWYTNIAKTKI